MVKRKNMKRKIPIFTLRANYDIDYDYLVENKEIRNAIIDETLCAIKDGINKNKKSTFLFEIANSDCYIELKKNEWKVTLENVLQHYLEKEEYDKCIECRNLINKL